MAIRFFTKHDSFKPSHKRKYYHWLRRVFDQEEKQFDQISVIFCSDDYLADLNQKYLNHDTLTDVITFPYHDNPISGDVFISIDRIKENARIYKTRFEDELKRVIVHGVLHLCGYDDKTKKQKEKLRRLESYYIEQY